MILRAARLKDGIVVNMESVTSEWLEENQNDPVYQFITYAQDAIVGIGYTYDADLDEFIAPTIEEGTDDE